MNKEMNFKDYKNPNNEWIAKDGIINQTLWDAAKYKILWVLKEAYGEPLPEFKIVNQEYAEEDKIYDYSKYLDEYLKFGKLSELTTAFRMLTKISQVNYGIQNKYSSVQQIPNINEKEQVLLSLKSCAIINLKKTLKKLDDSNHKESNPDQISGAFHENTNFIINQISEINPDIIICGGTEQDIYSVAPWKVIPSEAINPIILGSANGDLRNNKIFIEAYHPSAYVVTDESYINDILNIVNQLLAIQGK